MKTYYGLFDGGVNYRDDHMGINELRDVENLYWEGHLKRRLGYETRSANLTSPDTGNWPSSGLQIVDHIRLNPSSGSDQHFLLVSMADTGGSTDVITAYYCSGIPDSTAESYSIISTSTNSTAGVGGIIPWSTSDPISVTDMDDKVWIALGDDNPYILFYATGGTSWNIHEYPLCLIDNNGGTGNTDGTNIIPGSTDATTNAGWDGSKIVGSAGGHMYVSDGRTVYYAVSEGNVRADLWSTYTAILDRSSGVHSGDDDWVPGWGTEQFEGLEKEVKVTQAAPYKKYVFFYGEGGLVSFYLRDLYSKDLDKTVETREGVYGRLVTCEKGLFWVGKDGIYGYDGSVATDLAKKVWPRVEDEHTTIPDDFDECSLAYHDGRIWISFPNGTDADVFTFDPDLIYDDEYGDSHAPMYRFSYTNSTGRTAQPFHLLREYETSLLAVDNSSYCRVYKLEAGGKDNESAASTGEFNGIGFDLKTPWYDQDQPNLKKAYRQVVIETNQGLYDGTTDSNVELYFAASHDFSTGDKNRGITSSGDIDLTNDYGQHAYQTLDIPYSASGSYSLDGNSLSMELIGYGSGISSGVVTTGAVDIYGITLDYGVKNRTVEELST